MTSNEFRVRVEDTDLELGMTSFSIDKGFTLYSENDVLGSYTSFSLEPQGTNFNTNHPETSKNYVYRVTPEANEFDQTVGTRTQEIFSDEISTNKYSRDILQAPSTTSLLFSTKLGSGVMNSLIFIEVKLIGKNRHPSNPSLDTVYMADIKQAVRWQGTTPILIGTPVSTVFSTTESGTTFSFTTSATDLILNVVNAEIPSAFTTAEISWSAIITITLKLF